MRPSRVIALALAAGIGLLSGCGDGKTPPEHEERLLKAAGVTRFRITCTKDIWEATKPVNVLDDVTVVSRKGKVYTYELTGTELVAYLEKLNHEGHDAWLGASHTEEAIRMYDTIGPMVDSIRPTPGPGAEIPQVTLDDAVTPSAGVSASA